MEAENTTGTANAQVDATTASDGQPETLTFDAWVKSLNIDVSTATEEALQLLRQLHSEVTTPPVPEQVVTEAPPSSAKDILLPLVGKPDAVKLKDAKAAGHPKLEGVPGTLTICCAACEVVFPSHFLNITVAHDSVVPV